MSREKKDNCSIQHLHGVVVKSTGSWYMVQVKDHEQLFACKVKGNFRLKGIRSTNPVAVGDQVQIEANAEGTGFISHIEERKNYLVRKASNLSKQSHILAANIDLAMLVITIAHPKTSTTFIDRFLAGAEAYQVPVLLVFNKVDLYNQEEQSEMESLIELYSQIGYDCIAISATTGLYCEQLIAKLKGKMTLLSGNSGVGKSTLINYLIPQSDAKTAAISLTHDTGMHTTTFSQTYELPFGGSLIDTPGIKGFGTFEIARAEMGHYFRELFQLSEECRFGTQCTHTHEPGCAILQAVEKGQIALSRYSSYLSMLEDEEEGKYRAPY